MTVSLYLRRTDPAHNMQRFYGLALEPDLFGGVRLVRRWGRIGAGGQSKAEHYSDEAAAAAAFEKQATRKRRRGYEDSD